MEAVASGTFWRCARRVDIFNFGNVKACKTKVLAKLTENKKKVLSLTDVDNVTKYSELKFKY